MTHNAKHFPIGKLRKYPHMRPADIFIWESFLDTKPWPGATVQYDVHVGTPAEPLYDLPPEYLRMIYALSTKRIDVVVTLPPNLHIVELKPAASTSAIGQALCYTELYRRQFKPPIDLIPTIVTNTAHADTPYLCNLFQIALFETNIPLPDSMLTLHSLR